MMPMETAATFFAASILLALAPGPDNIFVLSQSALHGKGAGLMVTTGLCTGLMGHTAAVAFGVAALVQASALAFTVLKLAGAGYLLYLAWQMLRASTVEIHTDRGRAPGAGKLYFRGIVMNITNPKVSIFFLAFLPQFADPRLGALPLQIMMLGGVFIAATLMVFGGIAFLAGYMGPWLNQSPKAQRIMNGVAGSVFIALALKLATSRR